MECKACLAGKAKRQPIAYKRKGPGSSKFGDQINMDIWGPASVQSQEHHKYFLTLIDDATRWLECIPMKTKNEAFGKYRDFQKNLQTKHGITIKILHSDRESEFLSDKFQKYLAEQGTEQKLTVHDTPQHNGIAERAHQTIINGITSVMYGQSLPNHLWNETLNHIVYTYNWTPRATLSFKTLYKARFEIILDISSCKSWGAKVIVTLGKHTKMQLKGEEAFYIGPDSTSNGYRV